MITRKVPYCCPVCGGNGIVAAGFYTQTSGCWTSTGGFEMCRSCNGSGIVYGEETEDYSEQTHPNFSVYDEDPEVDFKLH